ncbi:hypothetical protein AB7M56_006116 [Bradyrhizobium elkanii]|nr:hypothetical protein [Bradyrhizobium elkanii]MCS4066945.1 hypothetical protein [Bradyrhizobium elkanii]MCS4082480.1 hypothetical protein [Bradyrhizobium elkanii]MCW2127901.1 hypothetical protein [Bradyrhizobium elkanii]MCW2174644.1 hypothetical protein [Bradyrhizobium elkanii]
MKIDNGLLVAAAVVCGISAAPAFAKTAKECTAEWRADKAGMQARGVTEKAYVEQCRRGAEPTAAAPAPKPAETAPPPAPRSATATGTKTAKDCTAEWRADKAGMQSRGVTERAYVEQCRTGSTMPSATAPELRPAPTAPSPGRAAPTATQAAPAPAPQRSAPATTAAPVPTPVQQPSVPRDSATLEAGQFADEASAKARCPSDTVVWVNLPSKVYHFAGTRSYGTTKRGAYMCEKDAIAAEDRASKTEKHP